MSVFIPSRVFVRVGDKFCPYFTEIDPLLKSGPTLVYEKLFRLAYKTGTCWPSQEYLALICKTTVKSVQTHLRKLTVLEYISIEQRDGHNLYTLLLSSRVRDLLARANVDIYAPSVLSLPVVVPSPLPHPDYPKKFYSEGENFSPYLRDQEQESPLTPLPVPRSEDTQNATTRPLEVKQGRGGFFTTGFEDLWNAWPQSAAWPMPRNRERALRVFASRSRKGALPPLGTLLESVERFKATDSRWQNGYPPELANWLYADGWKQEAVQRHGEGQQSTSRYGRTIPHVSPAVDSALSAQVRAVRERFHTASFVTDMPPPWVAPLASALCALWPGCPVQPVQGYLRYLADSGVKPEAERLLSSARDYMQKTSPSRGPMGLIGWLRETGVHHGTQTIRVCTG